MAKAFASQADMVEKNISFIEIGTGLYAFTAEGDPNSGVIIGDESVMVIEAQANVDKKIGIVSFNAFQDFLKGMKASLG